MCAARYNAGMDSSRPIHWQWRVRLKPGASSPWFSTKRWKELRWRMTEAEAVEWGEKNGCDIEKIPHSGEQSTGYLGWGDGPVRVTPAPGKGQ